MSESAAFHATLFFFKRMIPAICNQVFTAYADSSGARVRWRARVKRRIATGSTCLRGVALGLIEGRGWGFPA